MSTLKVNNIITQDVEADLTFKANNTTWMVLTSAGTLSGNTPLYIPGTTCQVVSAEQTASFTHTATNQQSTGLSATITPSSVNSKIKVTFTSKSQWAFPADGATGTTGQVASSIWRAVGNTHTDKHGWSCYYYTATTYQRFIESGSAHVYLDEPNTTDTVTYYVMTGNDGGGHTKGFTGPLKFILEEVAG